MNKVRFESGKMVAEVIKQTELLEKHIESLKEEIENLKCCGNCNPLECNWKTSGSEESHYCDKWQSDGLKRKERKGE